MISGDKDDAVQMWVLGNTQIQKGKKWSLDIMRKEDILWVWSWRQLPKNMVKLHKKKKQTQNKKMKTNPLVA